MCSKNRALPLKRHLGEGEGVTRLRGIFLTVEMLETALRALCRVHDESVPRGLLALGLNARGVNMGEWHDAESGDVLRKTLSGVKV